MKTDRCGVALQTPYETPQTYDVGDDKTKLSIQNWKHCAVVYNDPRKKVQCHDTILINLSSALQYRFMLSKRNV